MPRALDRRGHLVPTDEFEAARDRERQARLTRFAAGAGVAAPDPGARRPVRMLDAEDDEFPDTRSHDPHFLETQRAALVHHLNSRG